MKKGKKVLMLICCVAMLSGMLFTFGGITPAYADTMLFSTGFESGQTQPAWNDTVDWSVNVSGYLSSINPECSPRTNEVYHGGNAALMYSGADNSSSTSHCYYKVFSVNIPVQSSTYLDYWIYPQTDNGRYVAVDFQCTDGTTLRDCGAIDQNGYSVHPNAGHGGNIPLNSWSEIKSNVGAKLAGKTINKIWIAYDRPASTGQYRGYIDDMSIYNSGGSPAPTNLLTGGKTNPSGVSTNTPLFSWTFRGAGTEKSFQILVASSLSNLNNNNGDMWDSGKMWQWDCNGTNAKSRMAYEGRALSSNSTYYWKVKTWEGGNVWANGGDTDDGFSSYATFQTGSLLSASAEVANIIGSGHANDVYWNTYNSLISRIEPSGYTPTSLTGAYNGMYSRDSACEIMALVDMHDYANAGKILRYLLQRHIDVGHTNIAARVVFKDTNNWGEDSDQPDGNYMVVMAYAQYVNATGDTSMENDFYSLIKGFTNLYVKDSNYWNSSLNLIHNPSFEHSRWPYFVSVYDQVTNSFAAQAFSLMIPIAQRHGDGAMADSWNNYKNAIQNSSSLNQNVDGQTIYGELRQKSNPSDYCWGYSWVNACSVAANNGIADSGKLGSTFAKYEQQGSFTWGNYRVPLSSCTPGRSDQSDAYAPRFDVIGKGLAWEMAYNCLSGNWNRLNQLEGFIRDCNTNSLFAETMWWNNGSPQPSDGGNQEQASWYVWAQTKIRSALGLPVPAPTNTSLSNGIYKICNVMDPSFCIDNAYGNGCSNGSKIWMYTYLGNDNQKWVVTNVGGDNYTIKPFLNTNFAIDNAYGGGCSNGSLIHMWSYDSGNSNQIWTITNVGGSNYVIKPSGNTNYCIDNAAPSGHATDGSLIHMWTYIGAPNQKWTFSAP